MAQAVFRCSNAQGHVIDGRVATVDDLIEAREYATLVAHSLIASPTSERLALLLYERE